MTYQPIIDVRRSLPWRRRIASEIATLAVWIAWGVLCLSTFASSAHAAASGHSVNPSEIHTAAPPSGQVEAALAFVALGLSALWAVLRMRQVTPPVFAKTPAYASHFGLTEALVENGRTAKVCVVHHDTLGRILAIETANAQSPPHIV
jgi:poly-beta-1,6-N-acetyl-D-glucosamine biosynthesis protein PgaD